MAYALTLLERFPLSLASISAITWLISDYRKIFSSMRVVKLGSAWTDSGE